MNRLRTFALGLLLLTTAAACSDQNECDSDACRSIAAQLVFNEIAGTGGDFAELLNTGASPLDVSGYGLTDSNADGSPRPDRAIRFPVGTVIAPGAYLLVMMESNCPTGLTGAVCFRGEVGLSQAEGENVHLVDASNRVVLTGVYPANGAPAGRAWARSPNGTGAFMNLVRSPGRSNTP